VARWGVIRRRVNDPFTKASNINHKTGGLCGNLR
jgi:hypothetical protein